MICFKKLYFLFLIPFSFFILHPDLAQSEDIPVQTGNGAPSKWDVAIGGGAIDKPTYEGSNHHTFSPIPLLNITWNDMVSLSMDGLSAYWNNDNLSLGGGLVYNGGRHDNSNTILFDGDDRLRGLGNIDGALGLKAFASYDFKQLELNTSVTKLTGRNNFGVLADADLSISLQLTQQLTIKPHIGVTWADQEYMQTYFGVTTRQSVNSRFSRFNASSGIKDVVIGLTSTFWINRNWFVTTNIDITQLTGDAAKSPISFSDKQAAVTAMIGYHF